jgi:hypothetical protein
MPNGMTRPAQGFMQPREVVMRIRKLRIDAQRFLISRYRSFETAGVFQQYAEIEQ